MLACEKERIGCDENDKMYMKGKGKGWNDMNDKMYMKWKGKRWNDMNVKMSMKWKGWNAMEMTKCI